MNKIQINQGNDETIQLAFTDQNGNPIDLTGCTVFFTVKAQQKLGSDPADSEAVIKKTLTSIPNPAQGIANLVLTNSETNIPPGSYFYDIKIGYPTTPATFSSTGVGELDILAVITKRTN